MLIETTLEDSQNEDPTHCYGCGHSDADREQMRNDGAACDCDGECGCALAS